jgi:hypothetical protein
MRASILHERAGAAVLAVLLSLVWLLAWPLAGLAQEVTVAPHWKAGDRQRIELVRVREDVNGTRAEIRTEITVTVHAVTADGFAVHWQYGAPKVQDTDAQRAALTTEVAAAMQHLRYELDVDAAGRLRGVTNWKDVRDAADRAAGTVLQRLRERGLPEAAATAVGEQIRGSFATEQQVLQQGVREAAIYHAVFGRSYRLNVPVPNDGALASPVGGVSVPSKGELVLTALDPASGRARISTTQTVDPEAARRLALAALTEMLAKMGRPAPPPDSIPPLVINDTGEYVVDVATGWVRSLTLRRESRAGEQTRRDILTATEIAP